tara:strand:+ start:921 stop:1100 length:180 start_codon:yes stop_codon:yes gene_type:complete
MNIDKEIDNPVRTARTADFLSTELKNRYVLVIKNNEKKASIQVAVYITILGVTRYTTKV